MSVTDPVARLIPAPAGWQPHVNRARLGLGWVASATYDINQAPDHVRAQATALHTDKVIEFWVPTRRRAVRDLADAIRALEDSPRDLWLPDCGFRSGHPDEVLAGIPNGSPVRLRYFAGLNAQTITVAGFLRVESWTSIGMAMRAYTIDVEPYDAEPYEVHLSEFGLVWDVERGDIP